MAIQHRDSASHPADDASTSPPNSQTTNAHNPSPTRSSNSRSTSPTKRRASEMDDHRTGETELDPTPAYSSHNLVIPDSNSNQSSDPTPSSTQASSRVGPDSSAPNGAEPTQSLPSIDEQVEAVWTEVQKPVQTEGLAGYVIAHAWLNLVLARSRFNQEMGPFDKRCLEGDIGPVNNQPVIATSLIDPSIKDETGKAFIPLKKGLRVGQDIQILPETAWKQVVKWYGLANGQRPIIRYLHEITVPDSDLTPEWQYELYPPTLTLRKLVADKASNGPERLALAPRILASTSHKYMDFLMVVKRQLNIPLSTKIKVARVVELEMASDNIGTNNTNGMPSPPESRSNSPAPNNAAPKLIIDQTTFKTLDENDQIDILERKDESMNDKYNGSANLNMLGLRVDQTLVISEESKAGIAVIKKPTARGAGLKETSSNVSSRRASPAIMTRGRHRSQGRPKGVVGLYNLGNTCYMNSALQCMRACQELTTFFISDAWKKELNPDNPIGYKGQIAQSYANILHELSHKSSGAFAPRAFKATLGRFAPMFSGSLQHDSQEFMSFLVDGLHEDLNRVKRKPYRENPDSDDATANDPEAIRQLGEVFRDNHRARNSSVITDLFNGFYKNKLVCPVCQKISITFDPFSLLTLQLPLEHYWEYSFEIWPLNSKPIIMRVNNSMGQTMKDLKQFVASKFPGLDANRLLMYETFSNKIYRLVEDRQSIAEVNMLPADDMVMHELDDIPTNFPPKPKRSMLDVGSKAEPEVPAEEERQLVTVYNRLNHHNISGNRTLTLTPTFITLSREEASDYTEIYRKVLRAIANMTMRNLNELVAEAAKQRQDAEFEGIADIGEAPNSEATSDSMLDKNELDDGVKSRSLASDSFVDVTMDGATDEANADGNRYRRLAPAYSFLEKGAPIPAPLTELFEIYVNRGTEAIPFGNYTSSVEPGKPGTLLTSRIPKTPAPSTPEEASDSPSQTEASDESTQEQEDSVDQSLDAQMSYEAEEDGTLSSMSFKPGSTRNKKGRRNKSQQKKYGKNQRLQQNNHQPAKRLDRSSQDSEEPLDDPRLIRPYECIGIDWNEDYFQQLFGKSGGEARKQCDLFSDPELDKKLSQRELRRKTGVTLEDCFAESAKEEILTADNLWHCTSCKEGRQAAKKLEIWTCPDVLVLHLKRFSSSRNLRDKVDMLVDFPVEGLDLTSRVGVDEGKPLVYDLFAVDNHVGNTGGGHYTAFVKNSFNDEWYDCNDNIISQCSSAQAVVTPAAYLLFYRRRSDHPLGPPELQNMVRRYYNEDENTDSGSNRSVSPPGQSGNGAGPTGDLYHHGSSSASRGPVAARPPLLGGATGSGLDEDSGTEMEAVKYNPGTSILQSDSYPPAYEDDDEALGMEEDSSYATMHGGAIMNAVGQSWSFDVLKGHSGQSSRDSVEPNVSDDDFNSVGGGKMAEDFGDDMTGQGSFQIGPQLPPSLYHPQDDEPQSQSLLPQEMEMDVDVDTIHKSVEGDDTQTTTTDTDI